MTIQDIDRMIQPVALEDEAFLALPDQLRQHAQTHPDQIALREGETVLTWAELLQATEVMAKRLIAAGAAPGDVIGVMGDPQAEYMIVFLAILATGSCITPLPLMASDTALVNMIEDSGARFLIYTSDKADRAEDLLSQSPALSDVARIALDFQSADPSVGSLLPTAPVPDVSLPRLDPEALFNIIYSSGTTGTPKGIVHDNRYRYRQIQRMKVTGLDASNIMLVSTAMYSNTTLTAALAAMGCGSTLVMMRKFSTKGFLDLAARLKPTHTILVPIQIQRLLAEPEFSTESIASLQCTIVTSSPFAPAVKAKTMACWPGRVLEMYGMTEGGVTTTLDAKKYPDKLDSVGLPTKGAVLRIVDETFRDVPTGEVGEIIGRSPTMMRGYHNRPEQTANATTKLEDGLTYMRSGDLGRFDSDGFVYLAGRAKDVIISGGFNIYASDLEDALLSHPAVKEAAVAGVPSEEWGETPMAGVVLHDGRNDAAEDIVAYANARLGKMQRIKRLRVLKELPMNAIGKILRDPLAKILADPST